MGGSSTGSNDYSASNLLASITKQQYANYQSMYQPIENQQIAFATDPNQPLAAAQRAGVQTGNAFQAQQQGLTKQLQGQGIALTPTMKASLDRKNAVAQSLATDNAMNHAAQSTYDTQTSVLTGAPSSTQIGNPSTISQTL